MTNDIGNCECHIPIECYNSEKSAFAGIKAAMDEVSTFRSNALPRMANAILELDRVSADAEKSIKKLEKGNRSKPKIEIKVD